MARLTNAEYSARYRARHPDREKAAQARYRAAHPERPQESRDRHFARNPDSRRRYALKRYGLSVAEFDEMAEKQGGCKICGAVTKLFVDHDHESGRVRGLLCRLCNAMLGMSGDSPERLDEGAQYIRDWLMEYES